MVIRAASASTCTSTAAVYAAAAATSSFVSPITSAPSSHAHASVC